MEITVKSINIKLNNGNNLVLYLDKNPIELLLNTYEQLINNSKVIKTYKFKRGIMKGKRKFKFRDTLEEITIFNINDNIDLILDKKSKRVAVLAKYNFDTIDNVSLTLDTEIVSIKSFLPLWKMTHAKNRSKENSVPRYTIKNNHTYKDIDISTLYASDYENEYISIEVKG